MGRFLTHTGRRTVTATLTISYKAPVPVETPLELKVRIHSNEGRRWTVTGELRLQGDDLELATAEGVWIERRPDHFDRHELRLAEYRRSQTG
jgi:acyl-CoA thioesterase FadM